MPEPNRCICCDYFGTWRRRTVLPRAIFRVRAEIYYCPQCGLGRTNPKPILNFDYYAENEAYAQQFSKNRALYLSFAEDLLAILGPSQEATGLRLLDVGSGGGSLVEVAGHAGYEAYGVESNQAMVSWCQDRGLNVRYGDISNLATVDVESYDVIVLSAVLEHVADPLALLVNCGKLLTPNGRILVSQAAHDGLLPRAFPWVWYGWQPTEHFWHFTPTAMRALAEKSGCHVLRVHRNTLHHPWTFFSSIAELVGRNIAALVSRVGDRLDRGDQFFMVLDRGD